MHLGLPVRHRTANAHGDLDTPVEDLHRAVAGLQYLARQPVVIYISYRICRRGPLSWDQEALSMNLRQLFNDGVAIYLHKPGCYPSSYAAACYRANRKRPEVPGPGIFV